MQQLHIATVRIVLVHELNAKDPLLVALHPSMLHAEGARPLSIVQRGHAEHPNSVKSRPPLLFLPH